jgi:Ca-activated chloride channel family protein
MEQVDAGVLKTALDFHLVSRLTSLVADRQDAGAAGGREVSTTREIASMLPKGWDFGAVFGPEAEARALKLRPAAGRR